MKNKITLNSYPADYVEENLPDALVEIRYKKGNKFNQKKATILAKAIKEFLNAKVL